MLDIRQNRRRVSHMNRYILQTASSSYCRTCAHYEAHKLTALKSGRNAMRGGREELFPRWQTGLAAQTQRTAIKIIPLHLYSVHLICIHTAAAAVTPRAQAGYTRMATCGSAYAC